VSRGGEATVDLGRRGRGCVRVRGAEVQDAQGRGLQDRAGRDRRLDLDRRVDVGLGEERIATGHRRRRIS
jgi:hypothetical protein